MKILNYPQLPSGTPTPAPVKDDRSAKSPEAGSDQGSSAAGESA